MSQPEPHDRDFDALRERLTLLSEASLRINESLDFDAVLQGVLDSACSLTGARYGVMTLFDEQGELRDFLSSGLTAEEAGMLWAMPDGKRIFESLAHITEPMRVPDFAAYVQALGFDAFTIPLPGGFLRALTAPILHRGARVGHVFVGNQEDGAEFTQADEETLVMFASQAALVIANARTHREEQQARADLETLVETSPVGVVVLDARSGAPLLANREASRIVEGLLDEGQGLPEILDTLTCVRGDGREISLQESRLAELLSAGETVRAEEIVLRVPDGRSVGALLNATPIHAEDGEIPTFVVTLQDLTPLEEQERLRAEFLAMVSHELRTPLAAVKGSITTLLESPGELDPAEAAQFFRIIRDQSDQMRFLIGDLLDVARIETGDLPVDPEPADLRLLVDEATDRFVGGAATNPLQVELAEELPLVMADRRRIVQVLGNLLANAAAHSPDSTPITLGAEREGVHVAVSVADEGRGIPAELLPKLFRRFSPTSAGEGSGLGLAICKGIVEAHGGRIRAESGGPGLGARFTFTLPAAESTAPKPALTRWQPPARHRVRVLAVDDNPQDLRYVRDVLTRAGYAPIVTGDPADVPRLMREEKPHLVLLDLVLPGSDGIEVMNDILRTDDVPVIFLSVYGQDETVARAFDRGATDYVVKPFSPTELAARIRAALRRRLEPDQGEPSARYAVDGLAIDFGARRATLDGELLELTAMEYAVLDELASRAPRVLTYAFLLQHVWGPERVGEPWLVRDVVKRLRRKLGDDARRPRYILTEHRVGYRMAGNEADGAGPLPDSPGAGVSPGGGD